MMRTSIAHWLTLTLLISSALLGNISSSSASQLFVTLQSPGEVVSVDETTGNVSSVITSGLSFPRGIAYDPANGHIYVADAPTSANNYGDFDRLTIKEFTTNGTFVSSFDGGPSGLYGGGLAFDKNGNLYVAGATADTLGRYSGGQVREYATNGTELASTPGLSSMIPVQLATDTSGNVFVSDANGGILKYASGLTSSSVFVPSNSYSPFGIAVGSNGNVYVSYPPGNGTFVYDSLGNLIHTGSFVGGYANVLGSDGFLYALSPPGIYRMDVPDANLVSFSSINSQSLPGAEWMTEVPSNFSAVPEPGSLTLVGIGAAGLLIRAMRRRSQFYSAA